MLKYKRRSRHRHISTGLLITLEIFAIVTGVMLGFLANEWRENRANKKIVENALYTIASEMAYNHNQITSNFGYFSYIVDQIDSLSSSNPDRIEEMYGYQLAGWQGAQPPMLRSSAYEMTIMTGIIKDFPLETANKLAQIYNTQSVIERMDDNVISIFISDPRFANIERIRHIFGIYTEVLPSVMVGYQSNGKEVLADYGYELTLEEGRLLKAVERYKQFTNQ
ncbi:hypothetical protein [Rhodohalobacter sp.]|uniref:hypothetical protein n=1 Tax=Rhodohalobacter sp. TaxID=1974210 RepID=UPI002ACE0B3A|nr:hypothetical protein [Rhodohalobacter sp.]MDZ7755858.1 hypothetical protein [Rhodohalobacter sp.]